MIFQSNDDLIKKNISVLFQSFRKHNCYIVTQMPLPETQVDLWRLVYDHHIKCIIMLNELDASDEVWLIICKKILFQHRLNVIIYINYITKYLIRLIPSENY